MSLTDGHFQVADDDCDCVWCRDGRVGEQGMIIARDVQDAMTDLCPSAEVRPSTGSGYVITVDRVDADTIIMTMGQRP